MRTLLKSLLDRYLASCWNEREWSRLLCWDASYTMLSENLSSDCIARKKTLRPQNSDLIVNCKLHNWLFVVWGTLSRCLRADRTAGEHEIKNEPSYRRAAAERRPLGRGDARRRICEAERVHDLPPAAARLLADAGSEARQRLAFSNSPMWPAYV